MQYFFSLHKVNSLYHGDIKGQNIFLTQFNSTISNAIDFNEGILTDIDSVILMD